MKRRLYLIVASLFAWQGSTAATATFAGQEPAAPQGQTAAPRLPPADSPTLIRTLELTFPKQGNVSLVEPQTYLYYIQTRPSQPSAGVWVRYDEKAEQTLLEDFRRLWNTKFLDDLSIEVRDEPYDNGVMGKRVVFSLEERQRVKIVDYVGSKKLEIAKLEDRLQEQDIQIRLDTFIDPGLVRRVEGVARDMLREKGFQYASVTHEIKDMPGGPKLVHLTFHLDEGPEVKIKKIVFVGNKNVGSRALKRQMKGNKETWFWSFVSGRGTYQEPKFEEDAERIGEYYHNKGYAAARVDQPALKELGDTANKKKRLIQLTIPITEGKRYRVGELTFDGNTVAESKKLRTLFEVEPGDYYSAKVLRKGLTKAQEVYGAAGYMEFTGYPDLRPRDLPAVPAAKPPELLTLPETIQPARSAGASKEAAPVVDITMRVQEGKQYFVNRIVFSGNTTTRDTVVRREMRLLENHVYDTEALKYSIKRINQLGYFKPLDERKDVTTDKTEGADNRVDVKLKMEEQNRNQVQFGAGVSQFEGFFGQASFSTSNFLGRGESLTLSLSAGSRAQNYQLAFTEPFLFDRNITGGFDIFRRELRYVNEFTQKSNGGVVTFGFPVRDFTRFFINYSLERTEVTELNTDLLTPAVLANNQFLQDSLLIGQSGRRVISKIVPQLVYNTVDNPIFPNTGRRYQIAVDLAGIGGDTNFFKPSIEGVAYFRHTSRTSIGFRGQYQYIRPFTGSKTLPLFERLYLGGEYTIRGFDIRSIGPRDPATGLVIGGDKSVLFNTEYLITIASPVRLVLFYDAGQVRDTGENFTWREFKASTGAEVRFFMPVLNVPFRLIFAYNPLRRDVLDNNLQPQQDFTFRFAVGSTF